MLLFLTLASAASLHSVQWDDSSFNNTVMAGIKGVTILPAVFKVIWSPLLVGREFADSVFKPKLKPKCFYWIWSLPAQRRGRAAPRGSTLCRGSSEWATFRNSNFAHSFPCSFYAFYAFEWGKRHSSNPKIALLCLILATHIAFPSHWQSALLPNFNLSIKLLTVDWFWSSVSPEPKPQLNLSIKLMTVWWFLRYDLQIACKCQQLDAQIELSLWFGGPWIARTFARAQLDHGIADSMMVLAMRPSKTMQLSAKWGWNWAVAWVLGTLGLQNWGES